MTVSEIRDQALQTSKAIEQALHRKDPTLFFAAFIETASGVIYLSNGDRPEIQRLLPGLVKRIEGGPSLSRRLQFSDTSEHTDVRLAVERICAGLGKAMTEKTRLALFVFKNNEDCPNGVGINAYFSSLPDAPAVIRQWLARGKA